MTKQKLCFFSKLSNFYFDLRPPRADPQARQRSENPTPGATTICESPGLARGGGGGWSGLGLTDTLVFDRFKQTLAKDPVWLENFFVNTAKCWQTFYGFLQIYHSYYNEKLRVDKLASFALAYKSLVICLLVFENTANKVFLILTLNT